MTRILSIAFALVLAGTLAGCDSGPDTNRTGATGSTSPGGSTSGSAGAGSSAEQQKRNSSSPAGTGPKK